MVSEKKKLANLKSNKVRKALRLSDGDAGNAARLKRKAQNSKTNAKHNAKNSAKNNAILFNAARVEESLQNALQHHDLGIRLWRFAGMGSKEDKVLKEGQVWYVSITYIIMGEVGDEITMEKHHSKTLGKEVERVKTIRVNEGQKMKMLKVIH